MPRVCEPSWVGAGMVVAQRGCALHGGPPGSTWHPILLGPREIPRALPCKMQLSGGLRVEPHAV